MDSIRAVLDLSRDSINVTTFALACMVAFRFRSLAIGSLKMLLRGDIRYLPAIDWFLCGIWWMALVTGINQLANAIILRFVHSGQLRRILFDLNDHLMVGVMIAFIVALTSSRRLSAGHDSARRLLWWLLFGSAAIYAVCMVVGLIFAPGLHLADPPLGRR